MKSYILKKYKICFFCALSLSLIFIWMILLYTSINYNSFNVLFNSTIYGKENENSEIDIYSENSKKNENKNNDKDNDKNNITENGDEMINLLARIINAEARGEPYEGQVAVGAVILNRVKSPKFPNTIASVIYQNGQFSSVRDGQFDMPIEENTSIYKAATEAMNGADPTNGALYFYNPSKTKSKWLFSLKTTTTIGKHAFALGE